MHSYLIAIGVAAGIIVVVVVIYVAFRIYRRSPSYSKVATRSSGLAPRIVLTPSSPQRGVKRLFSPTKERERAARLEREERLNKQRKREKRKDIRSMWLPKRKDTLPITKTTIVQPMPMELGPVINLLCLFNAGPLWGVRVYLWVGLGVLSVQPMPMEQGPVIISVCNSHSWGGVYIGGNGVLSGPRKVSVTIHLWRIHISEYKNVLPSPPSKARRWISSRRNNS